MMRGLLLLLGAILLLPGICSLALLSSMLLSVATYGLSHLSEILSFLPVYLITFAVAWGGLLLIRKALRPAGAKAIQGSEP